MFTSESLEHGEIINDVIGDVISNVIGNVISNVIGNVIEKSVQSNLLIERNHLELNEN